MGKHTTYYTAHTQKGLWHLHMMFTFQPKAFLSWTSLCADWPPDTTKSHFSFLKNSGQPFPKWDFSKVLLPKHCSEVNTDDVSNEIVGRKASCRHKLSKEEANFCSLLRRTRGSLAARFYKRWKQLGTQITRDTCQNNSQRAEAAAD